MKYLILASTQSERLASFKEPMAFIPILGVKLIDRSLLTAIEAGFTDFVVVTAEQDRVVRQYLDQFARLHSVTIRQVINPTPAKGNAYAACLALDQCQSGPFVFSSLDYISDVNTLRQLRSQDISEEQVLVCVDRDTLSARTDLTTVTRVHIDRSNGIRAMSAGLEEFDGFSTGVYLCTPKALERLQQGLKDHEKVASLLSAVQPLISEDRLKIVDISGNYWSHIDSLDAVLVTEETLLTQVNRKTDDNLIKRTILRKFSRYLTQLFLLLNNANLKHISGFGFLFSVLAAILLAANHYYGLVIGAVLAFIAVVIHVSQEEIAELTHQNSGYFKWFDNVVGQYGEMALLLGLTLHISYFSYEGINPVVIGILAIVGCLMYHYSGDKFQQFMGSAVYSRSEVLVDRDTLYLVVILGALLNLPFIALLLVMVLFNALTIHRLFNWGASHERLKRRRG